MLPLLLGILAGNEYLRQQKVKKKDDDLAEQYRGLLGSGPAEMGPPDESGGMGQTAGRGLLGDPSLSPSMRKQMEFAAGALTIPGQSAKGLELLNSTMQRQMQDQQQREQTRQYEQTFGAGRADAQAVGDRFALTRGDAQANNAEQIRQWEAQQRALADRFAITSGMDRTRLGYEGQRLGLEQQRINQKDTPGIPGVNELPKLSPGYQFMAKPGGGYMAAPVEGTPDYIKGKDGLEALGRAEKNVNDLQDLMFGKVDTGTGKRVGGKGTEVYSDAGAQMSMLRSAIIADLGKLRDVGVMQKSDIENAEAILPDPTGAFSPFKSNSRAAASYGELLRQFKAKKDSHLKANQWLIPPPPPGTKPTGEGW